MRGVASSRAWDEARVDSWIRIGLVVAAFAPFVATLFYGFVYDDSVILLHNKVIDGWQSVFEVWKHPYWMDGSQQRHGLYRPLLMLCFAIVSNLAHKYALGFHFFAVSLHATATLLVAKLLRRSFGRWPSVAAALWFALHPVHVEAVANVSNSSEVLICIWTILLALWLLPASETPIAADSLGWWRAGVAALLYLAALLTKESGGVAPAIAIVVAIAWRPPRAARLRESLTNLRPWWRVIALWMVAVAAVMVLRRAVLGGLTGTESLAVPGLEGLDTPHRILAMLSTGGHVAQLLLWPVNQSPDYGPTTLPDPGWRLPAALATVLAIVLLLAWTVRLALRKDGADSRPLVAVLWCLVAYFPASNLLGATGPILGERTLYTTSVGVAMLLAWGIERALAHAVVDRIALRGRAVAAGAVAALAVACIRGYAQTRTYAGVWRDHPSLFGQIVRADSLNYRGYQLLAIDQENHDRFDEAARLYLRAFALLPYDRTLLTSYGEFLLQARRPRHALAIAQRLFRAKSVWTDARSVTLLLNATSAAWGVDSVLAAAQRLDEQAPSARSALFVGMAYDVKGDSAAAQAAYRAGLRRSPEDSALMAHVSAGATRNAGAGQ